MIRRLALPLVALLVSLSAAGCRPMTKVDRAQTAYESGDFQEAVDDLEDVDVTYNNGELPPDYALRFAAYRGLAFSRLAKETGNKAFSRKGRPWVRKALDRYNKTPEAKEQGWLDPAVVAELEEIAKGGPDTPEAVDDSAPAKK